MHEIVVIGNITQDAVVKDVGSKKAINFSIAINEKSVNDSETITTYYNCTVWRESNIEVAKYLTKGTKLKLKGTPKLELYTSNDINKGIIKIIVTDIIFFSGGTREIVVIGNITQDAVVKDVGSKKAINFGLAVNERYNSDDGKIEKTTYYNCTVWRKSNVEVSKYLTKGTKVELKGTPEIEIYTDKQGAVKASIKIIVGNIVFLGGGRKENSPNGIFP